MLKGPIVDKCKDAHLEGCDALAEGTLTYLNGDHDLGRRQIATGAAKNAPKDVLLFSVSLRTVASLPGAGDYKDQLEEIASILQDSTPTATPGAASKARRDPDKTNPTATTSSTPAILHAGTPSFRNAKTCTTVLGASTCTKGVQGPATVTMVFAPGGCPADMIAYAGDADDPSWWMMMPASSGVSLTRITLPIGEDAALHFAARGDASDPRCSVVWTAESGASGIASSIVPGTSRGPLGHPRASRSSTESRAFRPARRVHSTAACGFTGNAID